MTTSTVITDNYDIELPYLQSIVYGTGTNQATSYTIQQTNTAVKWIFKQISVENLNANSTGTTVALYLNNILLAPSYFLVPTPKGLGAAATGLPYVVMQSSDSLLVEFSGATVGDQINIQGLYTEVIAT